MISNSTKYKLYLFLKSVSDSEVIVEEQRQELAKRDGFEPYAAFKRIENSGLEPGDIENNAISSTELCRFLRQNHVDYIKETDMYPFFLTFDKDMDGNIDYDDFLQFCLPYDDMKLRAKVAQRPTYRTNQLPQDVEFELSRLIEKELHFHVKVEEEKKQLERQADFNTVACFSHIDLRNFGYIDFDQLYRFMVKFDKDVTKCHINAILRRLNNNEDFKIDFREFANHLTPKLQGFNQKGCLTPQTKLMLPTDPQSDDPLVQSKHLDLLNHVGIAFNLDMKKQVLRNMEIEKKTQIRSDKGNKFQQNMVRNFKLIYEQDKQNKVKNEFRDLSLKRKVKPDDQYLVNLRDISPMKNQLLSDNYEESLVVNRIACGDARNEKENLDRDFGEMWQSVLWGGKTPKKKGQEQYVPYQSDRDRLNLQNQPGTVTQAAQLPPQQSDISPDRQNQISMKKQRSQQNPSSRQNFKGYYDEHEADQQSQEDFMNNTNPMQRAQLKQTQSYNLSQTAKQSMPASSFKRDARSPSITDIDDLGQSGFKTSNAQLRMSNASSVSQKDQQEHDKKTDQTIQKFQKIAQKINSMKVMDIKDMLWNYGLLEQEIENHKKRLVHEGGQDFNTIDAFRLIDLNGQGYVTYTELQFFLVQNLQRSGVDFSEEDLALFMLRFDKKEKQRIKYSEFCSAFAPLSPRAQQALVQRQPVNTQLEMSYEEVFHPLTRDLYQLCWKLIFFSEQLYEKMRQKLLSNPNFNIMEAYAKINQDGKEYIIASDMGKYLSQNKLNISHNQEQLIFEKFSKRKFADKIYQAEFIEEFLPRQYQNSNQGASNYYEEDE